MHMHVLSVHAHNWPRMIAYVHVGKGRQQQRSNLYMYNNADARPTQGMWSIEL